MIYRYLKILLSRVIFLITPLLILQSCGYHSTNRHNVLSSYKTMTVPYVEGDSEGDITSQVIQSVCQSGAWKYRTFDAELTLKIKIIDTKIEDIGYNRFFNQNAQIERWMVPNEQRMSILAEVSVIDEATSKVILEPYSVSANVNYDFDPEYSETNLVGFSLAQYNFIENAQRIARKPLSEKLADNIVNYLLNNW